MATNYPNAIDNDSSLLVPSDVFVPTKLTEDVQPIDTIINVVSTSSYASHNGILIIDDEEIFYSSVTATTFVGCIRGADKTVALPHFAGTLVQSSVLAPFINNLKDAVIAIENVLGIGGANYVRASVSNVFAGSQRMGGLVLDNNSPNGTDEWSFASVLDGSNNSTLNITHSGLGINPTVNIAATLLVSLINLTTARITNLTVGAGSGTLISGTTTALRTLTIPDQNSYTVVPRDGLALDSLANLDVVVDPSVMMCKDDFLGTAELGDLGWSMISGANLPTTAYLAPASPHIGILQLNTATVANGDWLSMFLQSNTYGVLDVLDSSIFDSYFIFKMEQSSGMRFRIGFAAPGGGTGLNTIQPSDGLWLRCDTHGGFGDTHFVIDSRQAGTSNLITSTVVCDTSYHRIRFYCTTVTGIITVELDGTIIGNYSQAQLSSFRMTPFVQIANDSGIGAARSADIDFVGFRKRGLVR